MSFQCRKWERLCQSSPSIQYFSKNSWIRWSRWVESRMLLVGITHIQVLVPGFLAPMLRRKSSKKTWTLERWLSLLIPSSRLKVRWSSMPSVAFLARLWCREWNHVRPHLTLALWLLQVWLLSWEASINTTTQSLSIIARMRENRKCYAIWTSKAGLIAWNLMITLISISEMLRHWKDWQSWVKVTTSGSKMKQKRRQRSSWWLPSEKWTLSSTWLGKQMKHSTRMYSIA